MKIHSKVLVCVLCLVVFGACAGTKGGNENECFQETDGYGTAEVD